MIYTFFLWVNFYLHPKDGRTRDVYLLDKMQASFFYVVYSTHRSTWNKCWSVFIDRTEMYDHFQTSIADHFYPKPGDSTHLFLNYLLSLLLESLKVLSQILISICFCLTVSAYLFWHFLTFWWSKSKICFYHQGWTLTTEYNKFNDQPVLNPYFDPWQIIFCAKHRY